MADETTTDETTEPTVRDELETLSVEALRKRASEAEIEGRSGMNKDELIDALAGVESTGHAVTAAAGALSTSHLQADRRHAELQAKIAAGTATKKDRREHDKLAQARRRRTSAVVSEAARERAEERAETEAVPVARRTRGAEPAVTVSDRTRERAEERREQEAELAGNARQAPRPTRR